jgi:hypothetical protein
VISSDTARIAELEATMSAALVSRDTMLAGLEAAIGALGDAPEPCIRTFAQRPGDSGRIAELEAIAANAGV